MKIYPAKNSVDDLAFTFASSFVRLRLTRNRLEPLIIDFWCIARTTRLQYRFFNLEVEQKKLSMLVVSAILNRPRKLLTLGPI